MNVSHSPFLCLMPVRVLQHGKSRCYYYSGQASGENEKYNLVFRANAEHMEGGVREPGSLQPGEAKEPLKGMRKGSFMINTKLRA